MKKPWQQQQQRWQQQQQRMRQQQEQMRRQQEQMRRQQQMGYAWLEQQRRQRQLEQEGGLRPSYAVGESPSCIARLARAFLYLLIIAVVLFFVFACLSIVLGSSF